MEVRTRFGRASLVLHCRTLLDNSIASSVGHFEFLGEAGSQLVALPYLEKKNATYLNFSSI